MVFETTVHAEGCQVAVLQKIIRPKYQGRSARQLVRAYALGKVPGDKGRTGQRAITHGAQQQAARARHWRKR